MILDGVCHPVIHFYRVILYVWRSPFVVSLSLTSTSVYLRVVRSVSDVYLGWYFYLSFVYLHTVSLDATLLIIRSSYHLLRLSALPSDEGVLTY